MTFQDMTQAQLGELVPAHLPLAYTEEFSVFAKLRHNATRRLVALMDGGRPVMVLPVFIYRQAGIVIAEVPVSSYYTTPVILDASAEVTLPSVEQKLRKFVDADILVTNIAQTGPVPTQFTAFIFDAQGEQSADRVLAGVVDHKTRNQIRAAAARGVSTKELPVSQLQDAYALYCLHHRQNGFATRPFQQLEAFREAFGSNLKLFGAFIEGKLVAVNVAVLSGNYLWLAINASDRTHHSSYPNDAVYWAMIEWGLAHGVRYFDYGGSLTSDNGGVHFKEALGGVAHPLMRRTIYRSWWSRVIFAMHRKWRHLRMRLGH